MTVAAGLAAALAACVAVLAAAPGLASRTAWRHAPTALWLLTLALAGAVANDGGIAAQALAVAAGLLGAQVLWSGSRASTIEAAAHDATTLTGRAMPGTWLALPWLLAAALQPAVMPLWSAPAQAVVALATIAASLGVSATLPAVLAANWRWRLLVAVAIAFAPVLGPLELRDAWVEVPLADGAHASLRAAGRADLAAWPAWLGWAWASPRWLAVVGIAAMLAARPKLARFVWAFAGVAALAGTVGAAMAAQAVLQGQQLTLAGGEGPLAIVGDVGVGPGPGMARVGLLLLLAPLLDPGLRGQLSAPASAAQRSATTWAALAAALACTALALWAPGALGPTWPLDPGSAALMTMTLTALLRPPGARRDVAAVLTLAQLVAASLVIGGGCGWRVASVWLP